MASLAVVLRGIRYRSGPSVVVFVLAVVATTAAVLAPAYTRAAEQSALSDQLHSAAGPAVGVTARLRLGGDALAADPFDHLVAPVGRLHALRSVLADPYRSVTATTELPALHGHPVSRLVYRRGACARLTLTAGACPTGTDVAVSARTAARYHLHVGDRLRFAAARHDTGDDEAVAGHSTHRISGLYRPRDAGDPFWWNHRYFRTLPGTDSDPRVRLDAAFVATPDAATGWAGVTPGEAELDYPLRAGRVGVSRLPAIRADVHHLRRVLTDTGASMNTGLLDRFDAAEREQHTILDTVPVVAVPLVLLCWFVLYLMVASLTEERGPEIALARLRGFRPLAAVRFGLGEALLLIVLAAPVGLALGLAVVELVARAVLAPGTHVELRAPVAWVAGLALAGAVVAALLAARRTMRLPTMALLRRVPERGRWRATVVEGGLVVLAAAALYQVLSDPRSRLALLAPPLLALVLGLAAARLLAWAADRRLRAARGRLPAATLLGLAQLARRPIGRRIVLALTVAVSLLGFAAAAWDVAAHNRQRAAAERVGATAVYTVEAPGPQTLRDAVARIDPSGRYLMAAMQSDVHFGQGSVSVLAVDERRLPAVAAWPGRDRDRIRAAVHDLAGGNPRPLPVRGSLRLTVRTQGTPGGRQMDVVALVAGTDQSPQQVDLGGLRPGTHDYRADLPDCVDGCRLVGLGLSRYPGDFATESAHVTITAVRDAHGPVEAGLGRPGRWRYTPPAGGRPAVHLGTATDGLELTYSSSEAADPVVGYAMAPATLPVVLAGAAPTDDPSATRFTFPAFGGEPIPFAVVGRVDVLPRVGRHALLADLADVQHTLTARMTSAGDATPSYQVWAGPDAPADLTARLSAAGLAVQHRYSLADTLDRLGRQAPALALRLYLIAGAAALLLGAGAVLLTAYVGAGSRRYERAALAVAGVPEADLRRAVRREYGLLLGVPVLAGLVAGALGAVLMVPTIRLVTATDAGIHRVYTLGPVWVPATVAVVLVVLVATAATVGRLLRAAAPERLRDGAG